MKLNQKHWDLMGPGLRAKVEAGVSGRELAKEIGCSPAMISTQLKRLGISTGYRRRIPVEDVDKIRGLFASGLTVNRVGIIYETSHTNMKLYCKRHGIEMPPKVRKEYRKITPEEVAEMVRMHGNGRTQSDIGDLFGVSQTVVSRLMNEAGHRLVNRMHRTSPTLL